ncbi:transcriptional repressor [Guyparkeria hydrothermalis]|uniref:transcriptional repressor n=1 Tax=Guyparkeria hydrothermalis TaxID=923 RepID=UPI002020A66B|nr:transcriptional repressor [Guyparkeria hydrothermalis]MCL7744621.1 transcriptional repressor [Guyparkeria hydrothermalis]
MACADHHQCIDDALARAEAICARSGARLTPIRRDVLREVWSSHEATKAYDLIERLSRDGEQIKPPTVYRALDFLLEHGLIHRIESLNAFVGCEHPQEAHQAILMICDRCGDIREDDNSEVQAALKKLASETGFVPRSAVIELRGLCRNCRATH